MSEAYTRYVQRIAAVDAFLREQEAPEELQLRVIQVQQCATVSRQIRAIESQRKLVTSKATNNFQVRKLLPATNKRPQRLQVNEPQKFNMVWDNWYSRERAQWVYKTIW